MLLETMSEYNYLKSIGYEPLTDFRFKLNIDIRLEIQNELFGKPSLENDYKYYNWCWENKGQICEETGIKILRYSAKHISHILSRSAYTEIRYDPRNCNILTTRIHNVWDNGTEEEKKKLKIYWLNKLIIKILKYEYRRFAGVFK